MSKFITERQQQILELIKNHISEYGQSPTLSELQIHLGIKTKRGVVKHLEALDKKGFIYRMGGTRGIKVMDNSSTSTLSIPILGYANAGTPLVFAEEEIIGSIHVDAQFIKDNQDKFGLIIKGDSMNMRSINKVPLLDKNYVVVQKNTNIKDGDVVLAVIDNSATLKTFKRSKNAVILYPESSNPKHTPIYLRNDIEGFINGKVIAVLENPAA